MPKPGRPPIGLQLARTAKTVSRAFDDALVQAGGSLPVWLVLLNIKSQQLGNQRELADEVGIKQATLTHHLNAMDAQGLVTRRRDPANRRVHLVELTEAGEAAFVRLREAAFSLDGLMQHDTELDPKVCYTDTHGYTEVVMATAALLGYELAPRIRH